MKPIENIRLFTKKCPVCKKAMATNNKFCSLKCYDEIKIGTLKEFKLPFMVLHRDDVKNAIGHKAKILTDSEMQEIADELGKHLAQDWDILIKEILFGGQNGRI